MDIFTQKEISLLLKEKNWDNNDIRNIYYLIAVTGITFDDALSLTWENIDIQGKFLSLKDERKKIRLIPLNNVALQFIGKLEPGDGPVFGNLSYTGNEFYEALEKSGIKADGRSLFPESVRGAFLDALKKQGHTQDVISRVYGEF